MKISNLRWWIAGLLLLASILNYIDRTALSILAPTIQAELALTDAQYGRVVSLFLVAYTIAYLVSGRIVDAIGPRASLALFVGWWSIANMLTGLARSVFSLGSYRFLLGLGEAGGYTASPKIVSQWFPPKDRGIAVGLYSVGGALGARIAPVLVLWLTARFGWRGAFVATGALGLVFVVVWLAMFRRPEEHPWLTEKERSLIQSPEVQAETTGAALRRDDSDPSRDKPAPTVEPQLSEAARWKSIVTTPAVWALMLARLLTDPVWYFFQFWMPKYLHSARGFAQEELAHMWMIYLAADIGFVGSGFVSAYLIRRGNEARQARLRTMLGCAVFVPLAPLVALSQGTVGVFAVSMVIVLAHTAWLASISTYVVDLVPKSTLGTAFGFIAAGSAVGGILMNQAVTWTIARFSYDYCFYAMVALHPLAFALVWRFARRPWVLATT
jgi:ACS family hexuronate transporter-like MFS transporter